MNVWGLHAGKHGDADILFFGENCIAIGWPKVHDLSTIGYGRKEIKEAIRRYYNETNERVIGQDAGIIYRFVSELAINDVVVFSSWRDHHLHFARVMGGYYYDERVERNYPHRRKVKWLVSFPHVNFTQPPPGVGINQRRSFFQILDEIECNEYVSKIRYLL